MEGMHASHVPYVRRRISWLVGAGRKLPCLCPAFITASVLYTKIPSQLMHDQLR
jgi:hypothetical protein